MVRTSSQWKDLSRLGVAFDTETWLIEDGNPAPPLVCGSIAHERHAGILDKEEFVEALFTALRTNRIIIGANIPFDFLVVLTYLQNNSAAVRCPMKLLDEIFRAYREGRVFDVLIAEQLHHVGLGCLGKDPKTGKELRGYSLEAVYRLVTGKDNAKENDEWRLRYKELDSLPMSQWPETAKIYPVDDARNTYETACLQVQDRENLHDHSVQVYAAWCLHLAGAWGLRTDPIQTERLKAEALALSKEHEARFLEAGFLRVDGSANKAVINRAVAQAYDCLDRCDICDGGGKVPGKGKKERGCVHCSSTGLFLNGAVPRTEPSATYPNGQVQSNADTLIESDDPLLVDFGLSKEDAKILTTYGPFLEKGYERPITLRANPILETGRVSYRGVVQTLPRNVSTRLQAKGFLGLRDCIVPRPGNVFYSVDYKGGELVTLAESCVRRVGFSELGKVLVTGRDVHQELACYLLGIGYDDFDKKKHKAYRDAAKPQNFGNPGGMGVAKTVMAQRKNGPDTEWPDGPTDLGGGKRGYKGLRFCLLIGGEKTCGHTRATEWRDRPIPPLCKRCLEVANEAREAWFRRWPEMKPYFRWHAENCDNHGYVIQHYSGRKRGGVEFTQAANGDFQALLADIAKRAQIRVTYEQYVRGVRCEGGKYDGMESPLYGSRSIVFVHDELFGEAREDVAADVAERVTEIMVEEFKKGCPVHAKACAANPALMRRWYKQAEEKRDEKGRLIPWEPR